MLPLLHGPRQCVGVTSHDSLLRSAGSDTGLETVIKVLHVVSSLELGGVTRVVTDICNCADFDRHEVSIVSLQDHEPAGGFVGRRLHPNVKLYTINYNFDPEYSLPAFFKAAFLD